MDENPYEPPQSAGAKIEPADWPPAKYALLGFPLGWLFFPVLWLVGLARHGGSFAGFWYELGLVAAVTISIGTTLGAVLSLIFCAMLRTAQFINARR